MDACTNTLTLNYWKTSGMSTTGCTLTQSVGSVTFPCIIHQIEGLFERQLQRFSIGQVKGTADTGGQWWSVYLYVVILLITSSRRGRASCWLNVLDFKLRGSRVQNTH